MKAKLEYCLRWLREGAVRVVRSYPVETLLALYACIRCLLTYELDWSEEELFNRLGLVPLFFALALAVNNLAGRGPWRKVYWVVWAPIVPLTLWSGLGDWIESASFRISLGILAPLLLLLSLRAVRNDRFVNGALVWLRSGALALLFANVALGLFYAILYSATYIFGLDGAWIEHVAVWAVTICETLAVPLLFLMMADRWRDAELRGSRILEMLLNYIVTPALLIYAAILYLYMAKILVTWTLPEGGVAYLVFGFTMTALAVKALDSKMGVDIQLIEITDVSTLADYFLICTASSSTHVKTLCDAVEEAMDNAGEPMLSREGHRSGTWVLMDFGCVVVHVFTQETRAFYNLERLWQDGKQVNLSGILENDA